MLLYLRHGDDRGNDIYRHDRRLNDRGRKKAGKAAQRLAEKYGQPDVVFVSPFRRALETLECMVEHLDRVKVECDPRIAQLLGDKQRRDLHVSPATLLLIKAEEDRPTFRARVRDHVEDLRRRDGATWCITHQAVIEEVAEHFGVEISGKLGFLDHVVMLT